MDFDALRDGLAAAVPFNRHVGLLYEQLAPGAATVVLPDRSELLNHVGTQHAGALFTVAEAASGAAFVAAFIEQIGDLVPLVRNAEIAYMRPARGAVAATAEVVDGVDAVKAALAAEGRVRFDVDVVLTDDDGELVARVRVQWDVRRRDP